MSRFDPVPSRPAVWAQAGGHPYGRPAARLPGRPAALRRVRDTTLRRPCADRR